MKRNKIMALTALLTLIGAPLSKAQEKGGSQQSTSAQSEKIANKDSKATEQVKNQGQSKDSKALQTKDSKALDKTKDSKAPQQTKDSKTADKTKEETKKDSKNAQQTKEQPKDSKKDGKKENKNSSFAHSENLMNRMISLGYSIEWIKKNWPWLTAVGGTNLVTGFVSNKVGKNSVVDDEVNKKVQQEINLKILNNKLLKKEVVNANYTKNTDIPAKVQNEIDKKVGSGDLFTKDVVASQYTKNTDVDARVQQIVNAGYTKNTDVNANYTKNTDIPAKVQNEIDKKVGFGDLFTKDVVASQYTKNDQVNAKVQQIVNADYVKKSDKNGIKAEAAKFGIKYTDNELEERIKTAVSTANSVGLLKRVVNGDRKKPFDDYVAKLDKRLSGSLKVIQTRLNGNFADILVTTEYGKNKNEVKINNETIVGALSMLADIKNALVDKQALNFDAKFADSEGKENDKAWSDFYFDLGSKRYNVYIKHADAQTIYVSYDKDNTRYKIALK